jgi:hypothetical protein
LPFAFWPSQSRSSVVLPKPTGAVISVSRRVQACCSRMVKRGRGTRSACGGGIASLVVSSGICWAGIGRAARSDVVSTIGSAAGREAWAGGACAASPRLDNVAAASDSRAGVSSALLPK